MPKQSKNLEELPKQKSPQILMREIADDLFGKDNQEPVDTIQDSVNIINNRSHTIGIVYDPKLQLPAIAESKNPIKPIGVSCSHNLGYKRDSDDQINYEFENGITINANFYDPVRKTLIKHNEIGKNAVDYTIPDKDASFIVVKGKNVNIMISGLRYSDTTVGHATMDEFNILKKKTKTQLAQEIRQSGTPVFAYGNAPKETFLCNRIHGIRKGRIDRD